MAERKGMWIFLITFLIHLVFVLVFFHIHFALLKNTSDNLSFYGWGTQIAALIRSGAYHFGDVYPHHWYPLFLGIVFAALGNSMLIGCLLNAAVAAGSAALIYKLLREYSVSDEVSFWGSLAVANLAASFMYHSSILLKESWVVFLLIAVLYLGRRMSQGRENRIAIFLVTIVAWMLLRNLRFFIGFAAIAAFFTEWILNAEVSLRKKLLSLAAMFIVINVLAFAFSGDGLLSAPSVFDTFHLSYIRTLRTYSESANTANHIGIIEVSPSASVPVIPPQSNSPSVELRNTQNAHLSFSPASFAKAFIFTILGPFPGQLPAASYLATFADTLFVYVSISMIVFSAIRTGFTDWKRYAPILVAAGILAVCITLGSDNIGANIRQRLEVSIALSIAACLAADPLIKIYESRR